MGQKTLNYSHLTVVRKLHDRAAMKRDDLLLLSESVDKKHDKGQHDDPIGTTKTCRHYLMNTNDYKASPQGE